jgi:hypothetical protein
MITTFKEWLNESEDEDNEYLTKEEYDHIKYYASSEPEYDDEDDPGMPRIIAEYLEEIKAADPLAKKYLAKWNEWLEYSEKQDVDDNEKDYESYDFMTDGDREIEDLINHPFGMEIKPGPGVTYDAVSSAIEQLGEYRAGMGWNNNTPYCKSIRGWVSNDDDMRQAEDIVDAYEELVRALKTSDENYLKHVNRDLLIELKDHLSPQLLHKYRGRIEGKKFGI